MKKHVDTIYKPNFHFSPQKGWMNDPNGLFFHNNLYHLFYQYYPHGNNWGPMHWGHAVSKDLVMWKHLPIALYPDEKGHIWSGSIIIDKKNTSQLSNKKNVPPIIAFYTLSTPIGKSNLWQQRQDIAYSLDGGKRFKKYEGNPIIPNPGLKHFRDPKVFWSKQYQQWFLLLTVGQAINFYASKNILEWKFLSQFQISDKRVTRAVWECPDLFFMEDKKNGKIKWVLLVSINKKGLNGGSATKYFIGDFDGRQFTLDDSFIQDINQNKFSWTDYGKDNYAGTTWNHIPRSDGRRLLVSWMSNWQYANKLPTFSWRNTLTIPRAISLAFNQGKYKLYFNPIDELNRYLGDSQEIDSIAIEKKSRTLFRSNHIQLTSAEISFRMQDLRAENYYIFLHNQEGEGVRFGLNNKSPYFFLNRLKYLYKYQNTALAKAPLDAMLSGFNVRILLDKTSVEIFFNQGAIVMTSIFYLYNPIIFISACTQRSPAIIYDFKVRSIRANLSQKHKDEKL